MGWTYIPGVSEEELYHHGILGQKWGRRRYQNPDGSYTQAGRARYGIFGHKKPKTSKDAALRAKERAKAKNEEAKKASLEAKTERLKAKTEMEKAKAEFKAAKKQNTLGAKITQKLKASAEERRAKNEEQVSKAKVNNFEQVLRSGDRKQIEAFARNLNNDEYKKALDRVNMTYSMDKAAGDARLAKAKRIVDGMETGVGIWNATAGIISAFSGKQIPKISTKYESPIQRQKEALELEAKKISLQTSAQTLQKAKQITEQETQKAISEKAKAEKEVLDSVKKQKEWDDTNKAEKDAAERAAQEARAKEVLDKLKGRRHFGEGDNVVKPDLDQFDSTVVQKQSKYKTLDVPFTAALNDSEFKRLRKELSSDSFDISKLPKKQQKLFFAMLNSKMR